MKMSTYLQQALLNHLFNGVPYTAPAAIYMGLCESNPTPDNIVTSEVQVALDSGYARQLIDLSNITSSVAANPPKLYRPSFAKSVGDVTFAAPVISASLYTVKYLTLYDALTNGNLLYFTELDFSFDRVTGGSVTVYPGNQIKLAFF
jgi:hypothetical protein